MYFLSCGLLAVEEIWSRSPQHFSQKVCQPGRDGRTDCPEHVITKQTSPPQLIFCSLHFQRHALSPEEAAAWNAPDERNDFYNRPPPPFPALRSGQHLLCIVKEDKTRFVVSVISWRSVSGGKLVSVTMSGSGLALCGVTGSRAQSPLLPHHHSSTASFLANSQILLFLRYRCSALPFAQTQWRPSAILQRLCVIINSSAFIYCAQLHFPTGFHSLWSMMSCSIDFNRSHFLKRPL